MGTKCPHSRYRSLSFAGSHPWDIEISVYISQVNIKISVRIVCELIRKTSRCNASCSFICHCNIYKNQAQLETDDFTSFPALYGANTTCQLTASFWKFLKLS